MGNDLQLAGITLPNVVVGACPSTVSVDVINVGPDPASLARPMTVCLDIRTSPEDGPPAAHYSALATRPTRRSRSWDSKMEIPMKVCLLFPR